MSKLNLKLEGAKCLKCIDCTLSTAQSCIGFCPGGGIAGISLTTFDVRIPEGLAIIGIYFIVIAILGLVLFEIKEFSA